MTRCDVDKSVFMHFVSSVRWHCTILMKTTRLTDGIDRAVRGVCDIRPECIKIQFKFEFLLQQLIEKIGGFSTLTVLVVQFDEMGMINLV